ncbi:MAG TPA: family 20 glycosylhydrolase, partial [Chryseolinea sp.]|nr:family 20 glycosylhydrolase [Chryseolinea sp.]
ALVVPSKHPAIQKIAAYFSDKIKSATGLTLKTAETPGGSTIQFVLNAKPDTKLGNEGYLLETSLSNVKISANTPAGLFYGVQTLLQLLPKEIESNKIQSQVKWQIPAVTISDYPRFSWRGIMLDVSRHFFSKEYVKEYIDQLARYKFNRFHLHLTDDNGWRVEIKSLPRLTQVGAWRVPRTGTFGSNDAPKPGEKPSYGGFYTHEDIKELVQYAKERYVEIIPEIDVPGHSMAAIAAYPELCVTKDTTIRVNPGSNFSKWFGKGKFEMYIDNTLNPTDEKVYQFLDKVFTEVAALFPYEYIHMGGDECYKGYWERDPGVQEFMKKNKIANGEELQSYFTKRVGKIIASKKKKMIGWDEILEGGIAPGAAVMSWRGTKGGIEASHLKHPVVMSPSTQYYLDMVQGETSIEPPVYDVARLQDTYALNILPEGIDSTFVLGGQGNLWTEQIPTEPQVEYMTYPRAFAVAETMWSPKNKKEWNSFIGRVEDHFERFDEAGINYAPSVYDPIIKVKKNSDGQLTIDLITEVPAIDIFYTVDNTIPNQYYSKYKGTIVFPPGADMLRVITYRDNKPLGRLVSIKTEDLEKRVGK